jgi:acyl dehydratase
MSLGWEWNFLAPIKIGDVLHVEFSVLGKRVSRSRAGFGILIAPSLLINQDDLLVKKGEHRLMIPRKPSLVNAK